MALTPAEIERRTGGYQKPSTQSRVISTPRATSTARRVPTTDPAINQVGGQFSFDALANAYDAARTPKSMGGWVDDAFFGAGQPPAAATAVPGSGPSGSRGGGGGAGGGLSAADGFAAYQRKVLEAIGGMQAPQNLLAGKINPAVDADLAYANQQFAGVPDAASDPFAGLEFYASQFDPGTAALLEAQGMGGEAALAQRQMGQAGLNDTAGLYSNHAKVMSANQQSANTSFNQNKASDAAGVQAEIGAQRAALLAQAEMMQQRDAEALRMRKLEAILQLIGSGYSSGQDVSGIDFGGLL